MATILTVSGSDIWPQLFAIPKKCPLSQAFRYVVLNFELLYLLLTSTCAYIFPVSFQLLIKKLPAYQRIDLKIECAELKD